MAKDIVPDPILCTKVEASVFIVYKYTMRCGQTPVKYIIGVYFSHNEAEERKREWVHNEQGDVCFVNKVPFGDGNTELFTTNPLV